MLSLLYQQVELVNLEADLQRIALANRNSDDSRKGAYERNWWALSRCAEDGCDLQLQLTKKVQEKLKTYCRFRCRWFEYFNSFMIAYLKSILFR